MVDSNQSDLEKGTSQEVTFYESRHIESWQKTGLVMLAFGGGEVTNMGCGLMALISSFTEKHQIPLQIIASSGSAFSAWVITKLGVRDPKILNEIACDFDLAGDLSVLNLLKNGTILPPNSLFAKFRKIQSEYGVSKSFGNLKIITSILEKGSKPKTIINELSPSGLTDEDLLLIESSCSFPLLIPGNKHTLEITGNEYVLRDGDLSVSPVSVLEIKHHHPLSPVLVLNTHSALTNVMRLLGQNKPEQIFSDIEVLYKTSLSPIATHRVPRDTRKEYLARIFWQANERNKELVESIFSEDPNHINSNQYLVATNHLEP